MCNVTRGGGRTTSGSSFTTLSGFWLLDIDFFAIFERAFARSILCRPSMPVQNEPLKSVCDAPRAVAKFSQSNVSFRDFLFLSGFMGREPGWPHTNQKIPASRLYVYVLFSHPPSPFLSFFSLYLPLFLPRDPGSHVALRTLPRNPGPLCCSAACV